MKRKRRASGGTTRSKPSRRWKSKGRSTGRVRGGRWPKRKRRDLEDSGIATNDLLALTHAVYRSSSWCSVALAAVSATTATWEHVYAIHHDVDAYKAFQALHPGFAVGDQDETIGNEIRLWAIERSSDGESDPYFKRLAIALAEDEVPSKKFALVCSSVAAYRRDRDGHVSKANVGTVGTRPELDLALRAVVSLPNHFTGTA